MRKSSESGPQAAPPRASAATTIGRSAVVTIDDEARIVDLDEGAEAMRLADEDEERRLAALESDLRGAVAVPVFTSREVLASPSTVKTHFENVYGKWRVSDRTAAVARALRQGWIE